MLQRICKVQIQPRKRVLDQVGFTASARQHELDHTDQNIPALKHVDHEVGADHTDHLPEVCNITSEAYVFRVSVPLCGVILGFRLQ